MEQENEVVEIHEETPSGWTVSLRRHNRSADGNYVMHSPWRKDGGVLRSGEPLEPRWSEFTIRNDIKEAMSLVKLKVQEYLQDVNSDENFNNFHDDEKTYEECELHHGCRTLYHPDMYEQEIKGDIVKEDWILWNRAWRKVLFQELIKTKKENECLYNSIREYEDDAIYHEDYVSQLHDEHQSEYESLEKGKNEKLKEKDKKIEFLEELNSSYREQIDNLRFQLLQINENEIEIA